MEDYKYIFLGIVTATLLFGVSELKSHIWQNGWEQGYLAAINDRTGPIQGHRKRGQQLTHTMEDEKWTQQHALTASWNLNSN